MVDAATPRAHVGPMPIELQFPRPRRSLVEAMRRGFKQRCPNCGKGALFYKYLKTNDRCAECGQELFHHRADDAPAYFTIVIVGHIVVAVLLAMEKAFAPPTWVSLAVSLPITLLSALWLLPRIKGALVGLQWALYMHGFGGVEPAPEQP